MHLARGATHARLYAALYCGNVTLSLIPLALPNSAPAMEVAAVPHPCEDDIVAEDIGVHVVGRHHVHLPPQSFARGPRYGQDTSHPPKAIRSERCLLRSDALGSMQPLQREQELLNGEMARAA